MENEKLNIEELRQKREKLRAEKKKKTVFAVAAAILIVGVIVLFCFLNVLNKGTVNLERVKKGTTKVIDKDQERQSVLNIYADDMSGSFNPAYAVSYGDQVVTNIVFEPLMVRNAEGELEENLISSLEISEDGLTYTIKLKGNVLFSDGTKMTARDVIASISAMAVSGNGGAAAESYERITGMSEFINHPAEFPEGFAESSDSEFQIVFEEASPDNLLVMETLIQKGTFAEDATDGEVVTEILNHLQDGIGTGAYCFAETSNGSLCTLKANENFRESIKDIKTVEFCSFSYYEVPEKTAEGALDIALYSGASQLYDTLYGWEGFSVYSKPEDMVYALYFNQDNAALKDEKVRQAIAYGFDRDNKALEEVSRDLAFDEGIALTTEDAKANGLYRYDKSRAKKLLREAGLKDGLTLSLPIIQDNETQKQLAEALKADLDKIGITLEINELPEQEYIQTLYLRMDFDLYLTGISISDNIASIKDFYEPIGSLPLSVHDSDIDAAYEALGKSYDLEESKAAKAALYEAMQEAAPVLVLGRSRSFLSVSADLSGFEATPHQLLLNQIYKIQVKN